GPLSRSPARPGRRVRQRTRSYCSWKIKRHQKLTSHGQESSAEREYVGSIVALLDRRHTASRLRDRAVEFAGLITTPLLPADYLDLVNPLRAGADLRGRIAEITSETRDA